MANHPIVHVEIPAIDPQAAGKFYAEAFNWTLQAEEQFNYMMFQDGGPGGAFVQTGTSGDDMGPVYRPGDVRIYIGTDDIETSLAAVEAHGGKTVVPKTDLPGWGWFAFFADPFGNTMALFTALMPPDPVAS
jgi:predicted enzyme related to lactoylglutathione lyase